MTTATKITATIHLTEIAMFAWLVWTLVKVADFTLYLPALAVPFISLVAVVAIDVFVAAINKAKAL